MRAKLAVRVPPRAGELKKSTICLYEMAESSIPALEREHELKHCWLLFACLVASVPMPLAAPQCVAGLVELAWNLVLCTVAAVKQLWCKKLHLQALLLRESTASGESPRLPQK